MLDTTEKNTVPREVFNHAELFRAARSLSCNVFQHWLLSRLVESFSADHGVMNFSFPDGYISAEVIGLDVAALSQDFIDAGPEHDSFTQRMRMQPDQAICSNIYAAGDWPPEAAALQAMLLRHGIHRQLGISTTLPDDGFVVDLYLSRVEDSLPYTDEDSALLTRTVPLLREALTTNQSCMLARLERPDPDMAFAMTDAAGWIQGATRAFGRALAELSAVTEEFCAPKLPAVWLHDEEVGNQRLGEHGWLLHTEASSDGFKVWLLPFPESSPWRKLTARQHRIAFMFALGHSAKEIATELKVSESTVRVHIKNVYARLGVTARHQLRDLLNLDMVAQHASLAAAHHD